MPMRKILLAALALSGGTVWLTGSGVLAQQPDPPPPLLPPPPPAIVRTAPDASAYPQNLLHVLEMIEANYVRPVARVDLLVAALSGLYEVTGESVPSTLRADVEKAIETKEELRLVEQTRKRLALARRSNDEEVLLASCRATVRLLDSHCEIIQRDGITCRLPVGPQANFGTGIDLEDNGGTGSVRILDVNPGGPAQKAGLRPGDRITAIDGKTMKDVDATQATLLLNRGEREPEIDDFERLSGQPVFPLARLTFFREGETEPRQVTVERGRFRTETVFGVQRRDDNSWDYWIDRQRRIAQVRLGRLKKESADELRQVLGSLQESGMRGLLLDLRGCPGGLLDESVKSAELFLGRGRIMSAKGRGAESIIEYDNAEPGPYHELPMMVLVNGETSGGGELIAAALQDHARCPTAGQRTRGKASVQTMRALPAHGASIMMTTAIFLRPSGKNLNRFPDSKPGDDWGVRPDEGLEFRISAGLDRQLCQWWTAQTLRPGGSRERLPLDDPDADPQRQLALRALRERIK
jgi:C-terminal peptidase prc